ncbi:MAG: hypothetical protein QOJ80_1758 [Mycobacterium sp.]|jgi:hypothetical protein|nr:hypothetical protein [Mycobacterium sp.]
MEVDRPNVQRHAQRGVEQDHSGYGEGGLGGVVHLEPSGERKHQRRPERGCILDGSRGAEVDVGAEALLIHATGSQAQQRDEQQQHRRIHTTFGDQSTRTRREHRRDAQHQRDDASERQPVTQERRGEQCGGNWIHRDEHRAQHCRSAVLDRDVQREELHGLRQQTRDRDVAELAAARKADSGELRPRAEDETRQPEAERKHCHRGHGMDGHVADRIAQRIEEGHGRSSPERHPSWSHGSHVRDYERAGPTINGDLN